jgi:hypothetical protein
MLLLKGCLGDLSSTLHLSALSDFELTLSPAACIFNHVSPKLEIRDESKEVSVTLQTSCLY